MDERQPIGRQSTYEISIVGNQWMRIKIQPEQLDFFQADDLIAIASGVPKLVLDLRDVNNVTESQRRTLGVVANIGVETNRRIQVIVGKRSETEEKIRMIGFDEILSIIHDESELPPEEVKLEAA